MKTRIVAVAALALFMNHAANATVYYDSTLASDPVVIGSSDGIDSNPIANSFMANIADFSQISLEMSATTPNDGGSVKIYLVGDDGTGGAPGVAGSPLDPSSGSLLTTLSDAAFSSAPSLASINFSPATAALIATSNQEYWISLDFSAGSSAQWYYGSDAAGTGMAGQANINFFGRAPDSDSGAYTMIVDTPEPASLALFGGGLAALGYLSRRRQTRCA